MAYNTKAIPFEIPNINHGFKKAAGLLKLENDVILCEYRETDAFIEVIKSDVRELHLPLSDIQSVELRKGIFRTRIVFEVSSLHVLDQFPGSDHGEWVVRIKRKDRDDAKTFVSKIRLALSEMKLRDLEDEN